MESALACRNTSPIDLSIRAHLDSDGMNVGRRQCGRVMDDRAAGPPDGARYSRRNSLWFHSPFTTSVLPIEVEGFVLAARTEGVINLTFALRRGTGYATMTNQEFLISPRSEK